MNNNIQSEVIKSFDHLLDLLLKVKNNYENTHADHIKYNLKTISNDITNVVIDMIYYVSTKAIPTSYTYSIVPIMHCLLNNIIIRNKLIERYHIFGMVHIRTSDLIEKRNMQINNLRIIGELVDISHGRPISTDTYL